MAAGFLNGLLVTRVNLPPFIVTLGTLSDLHGHRLLYSGGSSIQADNLPGLLNFLGEGFGHRRLPPHLGRRAWSSSCTPSWASCCPRPPGADTSTRSVTTPSRPACPVCRASASCSAVYTVAGLIYGIAAWVLIGRAGAATPERHPRRQPGDASPLSSSAARSLFGGRGRLIGTLLGALIVQSFSFGLSLAGVDQQWRVLATGVLVIVAVTVDQWIRKVKA